MENEENEPSENFCGVIHTPTLQTTLGGESSSNYNYNYICPTLSSCQEISCPYKIHSNTTYEWRIIFSGGEQVTTLSYDEGKALEKQYCDPDLTEGLVGQTTVNFVDMIAVTEGRPKIIKRYSTPPKILLPKEPAAAGWIWYWQSDDVTLIWDTMKVRTSNGAGDDVMDNHHFLLERFFLESTTPASRRNGDIIKKLTLQGSRDEYHVRLNFNKMTMTMFGDEETEYEVRRRPNTFCTFVDWTYFDKGSAGLSWVTFGDLNPEGDMRYPIAAQELESQYIRGNKTFTIGHFGVDLTMKAGEMRLLCKSGGENVRIRREVFCTGQLVQLDKYPSNWDPMPKSRIYVTVNIPLFTEEFKIIQKIVPYTIVNLRRIQNPASYNSYMEVKARLETHPLGRELREELLFHGTKNFNITQICAKNFDPSLAGSANGMVHGPGTYFARHANYSSRYCLSTGSAFPVFKMFVCRVLICATAVVGSNSNENDMITLVNDVEAPTIFVNRIPHSFLPEYIVESTLSGCHTLD